MGLGTKAFLAGAILTFYSSIAAALGLGEITLNSALNQPLDAEIELLHVRDLSEREIRVGLASSEEFTRAGVDRGYFLSDLRFEVKLNAEGGPFIQVTSERPVREPFLNFLVSARWPSGKLLREYTLLVDLPVFSGEQATPVQAAPQGQPGRVERTPTSSAPPAAGTPSTRPAASGDDYGPVGANENLWSIAANVRPDSSVTVQQTMLALQRLNPEAFINNNINLLRRGQVLRVPSKNEIQALSPREAISEVANQNRRWSDRSAAEDEPAAQLEGSRSLSPSRTEPSTPEGRVSLSSTETASATGEGSGGNAGETGGVERQLAVSQEELDAASRENEDLQSRLGAVEEQIETMEKLVEVSSEELRALELAAQRSNEAEENTPEESADTPAQEAVVDAEPQASEQEPAVQEPAEQAPAEQAPVQPAPTATSSWLDMLLDNALYIAIGLGALLALVALWLYKRGRDDGFDDEFDEEFGADFENDYDPTLAVAPFDEETSDTSAPAVRGEADEDVPEEDIFANEAETEDVVGESDIHIAYGQYDQAEEKLTRALGREPNNLSVRMKLLEVFAAQGHVESFDRHFAEIHAANDQAAIDRATGLRSTIAGVAAFNLAAHSAARDDAALNESERGATDDSRFDSEASADELGGADDTLEFDFEDIDAVVESSDEDFGLDHDELSLDLDEPEEAAFNHNEDATVLQDREQTGGYDYDELALDEEPASTTGYSSAEEHDLELQQELDSSLDAIEDTAAVVGEDEASAAAVAVNANQVKSDSALLDDLDFDLDEINADLSFDDVELDLEFAGFENLADEEDDTTRIAEPKSSFDLPEEDASELAVPVEGSGEAEFSFDESLAPVDTSSEADAAVEYKFGDDETLVPEPGLADETIPEDFEFDLEKDVESAVRGGEIDFEAGADGSDFTGLEADFDDIELGEIELEEGDSTFDLATDGDNDAAANIAGVPLAGDANEDEPEAIAQALADAEQESEPAAVKGSDDDFGFDNAVDLDDLDRDLSELSSDFNDDLTSADGVMEEPQTDFGDLDALDLPEAETNITDAVEPKDASVEPQVDAGAVSAAGETNASAEVEPEEYSAAEEAQADFDIPDFDPESDDDSGLDFLSDNDETATKLDLARAYIDMGDADGAKDILDEIVDEGNAQQKQEAATLLSRLA